MARSALIAFAVFVYAVPCPAADQDKWVTIKGKFVWDTAKGPAPKRTPIKADKDADVAAKDDDFKTEEWIVNPKNGGIKNVVVWLAPEPAPALLADLESRKLRTFPSFDKKDIHPALAKLAKKTVEIDQPCCRFIPHVVLAREGQDMVIKNSAPVSHSAYWVSVKNGEFNPNIPSKQQHVVKALVAEPRPISLTCSMHKWMKAHVWVFSHPYYALTDEDGNFEIKDAPVLGGKLRLFAYHEAIGYHRGAKGAVGTSVEVKGGKKELDPIKLDFTEEQKSGK
jgi:hypothetical protein